MTLVRMVAIATVGLSALLAGCTSGGSGEPAPTGPASSPAGVASTGWAPAHVAPQELQPVERGLSSTTPGAQLNVVAQPLRKALAASGEPVLPPGSTITFDTATAAVLGHGIVVRATVTGSAAGQWDVRLIKEEGGWHVLSAEPASAK